MNLLHLPNVMLAQAAPAAASTVATTTQDDPRAGLARMIMPFVLMFVALYFLMIRPQSKRAKEQAALLNAVKVGDTVATSSGIIGVVTSIREKRVTIRSADTKLEILKSAVSEITERAGESALIES